MYLAIKIIAGLVLVAAVVMLFNLFPDEQNAQDLYKLEIAKVLLQLVIVVGAGTVFKVVYDQIQEKREKDGAKQELRRDFHDDLVQYRTRVEAIRRSFVIQPVTDQVYNYRKSIDELLQIRIELARFWHDLEISGDIFERYTTIQDMLEDMKGYLDLSIGEYEKNKDDLKDAERSDRFCHENPINAFVDFLDAGDCYIHHFLLSYRTALQIIRRDMFGQAHVDEVIRIVEPTDNAKLPKKEIKIRGILTSETAVSRVHVNLCGTTIDANNRFEAMIKVEPGKNMIRAIATDTNGNRSSSRVNVFVNA